jgi:8-oxo-dGTP pyrophosphatase MutT (NUDIX family)
MKSLRYEYRGEYGVPGRHYFVKGSPRTHHVHMLEIGGENWGSMLAFRDALLARPDFAQEYAHAKVSLAATYGDNRAAYQEAKGRVIERIFRRLSAHAGPIEKVIAYITRGTQLLVFSQPDFPDAGIQVPGGSVGPNESPQQAVLREALEETGLEGLEIAGFLGTNLYYSPDRRILRQHYFQLVGEGLVPEEWDHWENCPNSGEPPIRFQFWWVDLARVPELAAGRGALLAKLKSVG